MTLIEFVLLWLGYLAIGTASAAVMSTCAADEGDGELTGFAVMLTVALWPLVLPYILWIKLGKKP